MGQQRFDKIKRFLHFNDNSEVYQRKATLVEDDIEPDLGVGGNIVLRLISTLPEKMNYKIYFDNWFSGLKLMSLLKIKGFPCIGTLNKARLKGCPLLKDSEMKKRERGTSDSGLTFIPALL
ncbi:hypothetical protein QYM36_016961 [Artemia franciscana]|uniref:PiggyBac transposable element-derived protein domain-containing protein n=1 Tax=Artemia franciscana TaxID=6661 RepID=A0AA88H4J9_ARTSF|nr:hypothetical protein QYM36_016928 [Artemia franciscana]KAK2704748.1 hypothetical protein QYM36_016961 [Artemia franciscana]